MTARENLGASRVGTSRCWRFSRAVNVHVYIRYIIEHEIVVPERAPPAPPRYGRARARHECNEFRKAALAWFVSTALLATAILVVGDADRTAELQDWIVRLTVVFAIWSLWPITLSVWPARPKPGRPPVREG